MIGRERELALAIDLVTSRLSAEVIGGRCSGRSLFLKSLCDRLADDEWNLIRVRGIASLKSHPLAALHLIGIGQPSPRGASASLAETSAALIEATRHSRAALVIDDWGDLDESSWGVIESARRATGVPTVISRLSGTRARHTPSGLNDSAADPGYVIDLGPLSFEELERVVSQYLDGPLETRTMGRIFARSGGNTGLALSLIDATRREGRLVRDESGEWAATGVLWSPGLRTVIEAHLDGLAPEARDALEIIALIGLADIETVRKLVDWPTVELLEERALIRLVPSGEQRLVTVVPPLLAEFFRHEPIAARRMRLTELITSVLDASEKRRVILAESTPRGHDALSQDAVFIQLLQEQARTELLISRAEWTQDRAPRSAIRYMTALWQLGADDDQIGEVFDGTVRSSALAEHRAQFAVARASWLAYSRRDLGEAVAYFADVRADLGDYARLIDAAEVRMLTNLTGIPDDFADRLEITDDLPDSVSAALLQTQLQVLTSLGRFDDAKCAYAKIVALAPSEEEFMPRALHGLALIGSGEHGRALKDLLSGLEEARGSLALEAAYTFGTGAALCYTFAGNYAAVDGILDTFFATGNPLPFGPTVRLMLLNIAAVVSIRRGNLALGRRYLQDIEAQGLSDGPFPAQSLSWGGAHLLAANGEISSAVELLWDGAEQLWQRGARFAAGLNYLSALELEPSREKLDEIAPRLAQIDGRLLPAYRAYLEALVARDIPAMLQAFELTRAAGLDGIAVSALRAAASWLREDGDPEAARAVEAKEDAFLQERGVSSIDTTRFGSTSATLTDREREVATLAAQGLSNQEIATRLVLSVRTVETHMHRIMRKLDITTRQALRKHLD